MIEDELFIVHYRTCEYVEGYDLNEKQRIGNPPHFTQTLLSTVTADGNGAKFEGIVTGERE